MFYAALEEWNKNMSNICSLKIMVCYSLIFNTVKTNAHTGRMKICCTDFWFQKLLFSQTVLKT